jgi:serine/threonine-protein kinase
VDELEQTNDFRAAAAEESTDVSVSLSPIAKLGNEAPGVTSQFDESTRKLLRIRLIYAAATALVFLLAIKTLSIANNGISLGNFLTRLTAVLTLTTTWIYLVKRPNASLSKLRFLEILVFAIPVAEALLVLVQEVQQRIASGAMDEVPALFATICFAIGIFIAIYGMYIPAHWKRTLCVTAIASVAPTIVALVHQSLMEASIENYPGFAAPLMTLTMAAVATKAAHVVQSVRREAAEAKQYGQYHLLEKIGEGGMGVVYTAKHRMLKRPAAIKLIRTEIAQNPKTVEEFEHEVQLSASLTHWNTVQVYDYGRTDDGEFYYVMEFLEGATLLQRIRRGKLSIEETFHIIGQICDGLSEAHNKGMIHRDIKPANLFLTDVGEQKDVVKILDFGLAAMKSEVSRLKKVSGTPAYMSPEQIQGETIDMRSDIYSLGLVIYECLAGQRLMIAGSIGEVLNLHLNVKPSLSLLPESASGFADVIQMCIAKDPNERFSNVAALKNAMREASRRCS